MKTYYIGWDVGAWNCKYGSTDAIVIRDENNVQLEWKGNLTDTIIKSETAKDFIQNLFGLKEIEIDLRETNHYIIAIDTPLGFSAGFQQLLNGETTSGCGWNDNIKNPYLFRETERFVFDTIKKRPLSAVQAMIGSQATKGMHAVKKFIDKIQNSDIGVWKASDANVTFIEVYPAVITRIRDQKKADRKATYNPKWNDQRKRLNKVISELQKTIHDKELELLADEMEKSDNSKKVITKYMDIIDAYFCSIISEKFDKNRASLYSPDEVSKGDKSLEEKLKSEGWIWFEKDPS